MRDKPDAADLLVAARDLMRQRIVPALPVSERYNGLLVVAAVAIAARELLAGDEAATAERAGLATLLDTSELSLLELNREFARHIRNGDFDAPGPQREQALLVLRQATLARLNECNPGYLDPDAR
jgi:hypothetical protein